MGGQALRISLREPVDFPGAAAASADLDSRYRQYRIDQMGCAPSLSVCLVSRTDGHGREMVRHLSRDGGQGGRLYRDAGEPWLHDWVLRCGYRRRSTQIIRALSVADAGLAQGTDELLYARGYDDAGYKFDSYGRLGRPEAQTGLSDDDR